MTTRELQRHLKRLGFYTGLIDGDHGPKTSAAVIAFKASKGLKARDFVGPVTRMALRKGIQPAPSSVLINRKPIKMPTWLRLAYSHLGLREIRGPQHNADILRWWQNLGLHFRDDETPWCAGFVNAMILQAGFPIVPKYRAAALGWRWSGYGQRLDGPALGAIASMTRKKPGSGHMTIVAGRDKKGRIMGLGGNQGNMVQINPYGRHDRDIQFHWPEVAKLPANTKFGSLPVITAAGSKLTNEA